MRLLATADLHHNKPKSRAPAEALARDMLGAGGDALLLVGDAAVADGDALEAALSLFDGFDGPRLFVAGNHDLWTNRDVTAERLLTDELPRRVRAAGWRWLTGDPFVEAGVAVVGNIGWYDYSYAEPSLNIAERFYQAKVSPGFVHHANRPKKLLAAAADAAEPGRSMVGRWNDGRFIKMGGVSDGEFLARRCHELRADVGRVDGCRVVAAIHHVPDRRLLPPPVGRYAFARAYLGSDTLGEAVRDAGLTHVLCGHSHHPAEFVGGTGEHWINIGSGYRTKRFVTLDL